MPPPISVNRRRFLGCSAAASLALTQGNLAEAAALEAEGRPVRLGVIGVGNRGTALCVRCSSCRARRSSPFAISIPGTASGGRGLSKRHAERSRKPMTILAACSIGPTSTRWWLPCLATCTKVTYHDAIGAGKHLYAEKPLGLTLAGCDRLIAAAEKAAGVTVHLGFQRRSNPRFQDGVELIRRGELGPLIEARATWTSSNGPVSGHGGWLGRRERSGDWMVEQAVHIWDVLRWFTGESPVRASGWGRRGLFAATDPLARRHRPLRRRAGMGRWVSRLVCPELGRSG